MKYNPFNEIMTIREAATKWDLNQDSVKRLARQGKIIAQKLDEGDPYSLYLILKDQPNPRNQKRKRPFSDVQIGKRLTMVMET